MWQGLGNGCGGLQGWLLWEDIRSCPHVGQTQLQQTPEGTWHWPKQYQSTTVNILVTTYLRKGKKKKMMQQLGDGS